MHFPLFKYVFRKTYQRDTYLKFLAIHFVKSEYLWYLVTFAAVAQKIILQKKHVSF